MSLLTMLNKERKQVHKKNSIRLSEDEGGSATTLDNLGLVDALIETLLTRK